jgi:hydrogenase maturation protease
MNWLTKNGFNLLNANRMKKALIYAFGNPGRQDDALGNELVEAIQLWIEHEGVQNVDCDSNYQLNIEDAELISHYKTVFFVDASMAAIEDVSFDKVEPSDAKVEFSMHAVSPAFVVDLCTKMYSNCPEAYLIQIKGYKWEFMEPMTEEAYQNLQKAISLLKYKILMLNKETIETL